MRGWLEGNRPPPSMGSWPTSGILRKIPEEELSAAARGILFPVREVQRFRAALAEERKLGQGGAELLKAWAQTGHTDDAPRAVASFRPSAPRKLGAACLESLLPLPQVPASASTVVGA